MTKLFVPLDVPDAVAAERIADALRGLPVSLKVGSELFLAGGPDIVKRLQGKGFGIFLDLKFHDIPNTVESAVRQAAGLGVDFCTLHLSGGRKMLEAAAKAKGKTRLLGVTVLTSFNDADWGDLGERVGTGASSVARSVEKLAAFAVECGLDGVVCSAHELPVVRKAGASLYTMVPGIRPAGAATGDQARVVTPKEAKALGAKGIVVGRPITQAADPRQAAESVLAELQ